MYFKNDIEFFLIRFDKRVGIIVRNVNRVEKKVLMIVEMKGEVMIRIIKWNIYK